MTLFPDKTLQTIELLGSLNEVYLKHNRLQMFKTVQIGFKHRFHMFGHKAKFIYASL